MALTPERMALIQKHHELGRAKNQILVIREAMICKLQEAIKSNADAGSSEYFGTDAEEIIKDLDDLIDELTPVERQMDVLIHEINNLALIENQQAIATFNMNMQVEQARQVVQATQPLAVPTPPPAVPAPQQDEQAEQEAPTNRHLRRFQEKIAKKKKKKKDKK